MILFDALSPIGMNHPERRTCWLDFVCEREKREREERKMRGAGCVKKENMYTEVGLGELYYLARGYDYMKSARM